MNVPCPKCKTQLPVPPALMQTGVVRTTCARCSFEFVIRLGAPTSKPDESKLREEPLEIAGLKDSSSTEAAAGEIGERAPRLVATDTRTTIVVDDALKAEIAAVEERVKGEEALSAVVTVADVELPPDEGEAAAESPAAAASEPPGIEAPAAAAAPEPPGIEAPAGAAAAAPEPPGIEAPAGAAAVPELAGIEAPAGAAPELAGIEAPAGAVPAVLPLSRAAVPARSPAAAAAAPPASAAPPAAPVSPLDEAAVMAVPTLTDVPLEGLGPVVIEAPGYGLQAPGDALYGAPQRGRALGCLIGVLLIVGGLLATYVLYKNDWSLDAGDLGGMLGRAFTGDAPSPFPGLEVAQPIVKEVQLRGRKAVIAEGTIHNKGPRAWGFIYVEALLQRHGRNLARAEAPAGNALTPEQLERISASEWEAKMNPAGSAGQNTNVDAGQTIAYQVLLPRIPADYSPERYRVLVSVSRAEKHGGAP